MKGLTVALGRLGRHSLSCSLSPDTAAGTHWKSFLLSLVRFWPTTVLWVPWEHPPFWPRILPGGTRISKQRGSYETRETKQGPHKFWQAPRT